MPRPNEDPTESPFFRRNYGGFTEAQKRFYESALPPMSGLDILDPMGGQGYYLSELGRKQHVVWLGDISPAPLLLASLRDPDLIRDRDKLRAQYADRLQSVWTSPGTSELCYVDDWIAPSIREQLEAYSMVFGLTGLDCSQGASSLWHADAPTRLAAALPVLSARELVCFQETDNTTWLKRGGLFREQSVRAALMRGLGRWFTYAEHAARQVASCTDLAWGEFHVSYMDAEKGDFARSPSPDAIVTSPPYANRLDYTRLWAPELEVASALFDTDITAIKHRQIGSTVVHGRATTDSSELEALPQAAKQALDAIGDDASAKASRTYYYPFFVNYAVSLRRALLEMAQWLKCGGRLVIFVRDTVRTDVLFPTGLLVEQVLTGEHSSDSLDAPFALVEKRRSVIRSHVGMRRRRGSRAGVYGIAQQEWWLVFEKQGAL